MSGTGKTACMPPAIQHHPSGVFIQGCSAQTQLSNWFAAGGCVLGHFLAWLSDGDGVASNADLRAHHTFVPVDRCYQQLSRQYTPPAKAKGIVLYPAAAKLRARCCQEGMQWVIQAIHSYRNKLVGKAEGAYGNLVRLRPVTQHHQLTQWESWQQQHHLSHLLALAVPTGYIQTANTVQRTSEPNI